MSLGLKRIIGRRNTFHFYFVRFDLERLFRAGRKRDYAGDDERRADVLRRDFVVVSQSVALEHDLNTGKARAVVKVDKAERLGIADIAYPAADGNGLVAVSRGRSVNVFYKFPFHIVLRPFR